MRAAAGILTGDYAGGGSTITQQLVKNNVLAGGSETSWGARLERKLQEQYLAVKLEQSSQMSKEETKKWILTNYLNSINLGNNTLGVKTAARRYFDKELGELSLEECSVLAAITSNPSRYNPISHPEQNQARRQIVLQYMEDLGYISGEEREAALSEEVYEEIRTVNQRVGENTPYSYFTDELIRQVQRELVERLGYTDSEAYSLLYSGGLRIYSTQDPEIQGIVDEEISDPDNYPETWYSAEYRLSVRQPDGSLEHYSSEDLERFAENGLFSSEEEMEAAASAFRDQVLSEGGEVEAESLEPILEPQASVVLMDQETGQVKAIGGGRGEKTASLTLNRATDVLRQPGSAFKVLTAFAPALENGGQTLASVYYDAPYEANGHSFRNWWGSRGYLGYSNIRDGIIYSMNIVAVRTLMETVTPQMGAAFAESLGITSLTSQDITASLALGGLTQGVSNLELTAAYGAIANGGTYVRPVFFTRILDRNGRVLLENEPEERRVMQESTAFLLTDAMEDSLEPHQIFARAQMAPIQATSTRARLERMAAAGKSGTTTDNRDAWFVGFTPYYTAGIWTGFDDNNRGLSNTNYHKTIWKNIMDRIHEELPTAQRQLYESLQERIQGNEGILRNSFSVPYGQLSQELQDIQDLMRALLEEEGYLEGALPQETSQWWAEGSASLEEFLQRGIEEQWLSPMESQERYTSGGQAVEQLEQWILECLPEDEDYQFLLWRQMLAEGRISGEQVCMALLEQGKVADENGAYEQLSSGSLSAYAFLREKIRNLELTPAQLALDPSTASCVVVEPDTGQVLACVTYPGYDNNRLANQVDGDYYNQLLEDRSLPLYNNALQQETAPGSTFKPITAAAALTEGLIGPDTVIETHGIFEEITPSPRCWIYPGGTHGAINVAEAIRDSCNYFFYTLGYDMSLEGETYVPAKGIETLRHYVELFGLNERTGLEIGESEPQMADEFPVTAAIGQSNHNYTTAQLARYTAVLANGGNLYDLTLVDHLEDPDTGESQRREPLLRRSLEEISGSTWQVIDQGMTMMAESNDVLSQLGISVAGKTGTAQQNQNRPNHALFVGYGPAEEPQIAVATRIACGYSSANALEVTADIFRYYFGLSPREELVTGQADIPEGRGNVRAD